jgi:putative peptidoglycan lipid II flippase
MQQAAVIGFSNGLGLVSALAFDVVSAATFGLSAAMDAYFLAAALPQVLVSVCSSVGVRVLVPLYAQVKERRGDSGLADMLGTLLLLGGGAALALVVGLSALSILVMRLLRGRVSSLDHRATVPVVLLMMLSIVPSVAVEPLRAAHFASRRYAVASLTNSVRFGIAVVFVLILAQPLGILSLALGQLAGSLSQLIWLGVTYRLTGETWRLNTDRQGLKEFGVLGRLMPALGGEVLGQSNVLIERSLASLLPMGTVSALGYGRRILKALQSLLVNSVGSALLPRLSSTAVKQDLSELHNEVMNGIKLASLISGLASVWVIVSRVPLVALLFQRGEFGYDATILTSQFVMIFVPSVVLMSTTYLLINLLFALNANRAVMKLRIAFLVLYVVIGAVLVMVVPMTGLAYAFTLAHLLYAVVVSLRAAGQVPGLGKALARHFGLLGLATGMTLSIVLGAEHLAGQRFGAQLTSLAQLATLTAVTVPVYGVLVWGCRILQPSDLSAWLGRKKGAEIVGGGLCGGRLDREA